MTGDHRPGHTTGPVGGVLPVALVVVGAFLAGPGAASAQADRDEEPSTAAEPVRIALERGGLPGLAALADAADDLRRTIRTDTRAALDGREGPASVAHVTLRVRLGSDLSSRSGSVRIDSLRLETGRTVELSSSQLRSLEEGETVTAYAGTLPAVLGAVRVRARGSIGGSSRRLDRAFRIDPASARSATIRIDLIEDSRGEWNLSPMLESTAADTPSASDHDPEGRTP